MPIHILYIFDLGPSSMVKLTPKRRFALVLWPILALVFILGWIMSAAGESRAANKARVRTQKAAIAHKELETGLLAEIAEEQTVTQ